MSLNNYLEIQMEIIKQKCNRKINGMQLNDLLFMLPVSYGKGKTLIVQDIIINLANLRLLQYRSKQIDFLIKGVAIFLNSNKFRGRQIDNGHFDLEFNKHGINYIVAIITSYGEVSINSWDTREKNERYGICDTQKTAEPDRYCTQVIGYSFGAAAKFYKEGVLIVSGEEFWSLISGDRIGYKHIIKTINKFEAELNEYIHEQYAGKINKLTSDFSDLFCLNNGRISWEKLTEYKSHYVLEKLNA